MNTRTLALLADSGLGMVERAIVVLPSSDVLMGEDHDAHVQHFDSFVGSRGWKGAKIQGNQPSPPV